MEKYKINEAPIGPRPKLGFSKILGLDLKSATANLLVGLNKAIENKSLLKTKNLDLPILSKILMKDAGIQKHYFQVADSISRQKYGKTFSELDKLSNGGKEVRYENMIDDVIKDTDNIWHQELQKQIKERKKANATALKDARNNGDDLTRLSKDSVNLEKLDNIINNHILGAKITSKKDLVVEFKKYTKQVTVPKESLGKRFKNVMVGGKSIPLKVYKGTVTVLKFATTTKGIFITLIGAGLPLTYILYEFFGIGDGQAVVLTDENGEVLNLGGEKSQSETKSIEPFIMDGGSVTSDGGVKVVTPEYPDGLVYYNNGRVFNVKTKEKGNWTLNENRLSLVDLITEDEKPRLSLVDLINEQSGELSINTMTTLLGTAVNDLDGWVGKSNLRSLINIVKQLKGKTFRGKSAFKVFTDHYKRDEGNDFIVDINNVGEKTIGLDGRLLKDDLLELIGTINSGVTSTPSTSTAPTSTSKLKPRISWDNGKSSGGSSVSNTSSSGGSIPISSGGQKSKRSGMKFHDCNGKDFPLEFGCQSVRIKDMQECLGLKADGKFGPATLKSLSDLGKDISGRTITYKTWNDITSNCSKYESNGLTNIDSENRKGIDLGNNSGSMNVDKSNSPNQFYVGLVNNGLIDTVYNESKTDTYVRYKGPELQPSDLTKLDTALSGIGYVRTNEISHVNGTYFYKSKN